MDLAIIGPDNNSYFMMKIKGEYLVERIIRIGRINGISKVFWVINSHEPELKNYLSRNNFGIPLKLIELDMKDPIHNLVTLASFLTKEPFLLTNSDSVFIESEFSEFVTYSLLQEDADGILAITRYNDNDKPLCVAMNDEDIILKFSNIKEGYSWATGGIYYFSPEIIKETKYALQTGISGLEKFLQLLIMRGYTLKGFSFSKIIRVENVGDITKAEDLIKRNKIV